MPPFRLFGKRTPSGLTLDTPDSGFDASQKSPVVSIRRSRDDSPPEYKMSVVNDSGVYLPPSPIDDEEASFWGGRSPIKHHSRSLVDENEPFCMSRESFDSYRRSFDISARSPVHSEATTRTSLDSRLDARLPRYPRPTNLRTSLETPEEEDKFEDVGLDDNKDNGSNNKDSNNNNNNNTTSSGTSFVSGLTGGRLSSFMHSRSQSQAQIQPQTQTQTQAQSRPKRSFFSRFTATTPNQANESTDSLSKLSTNNDKETNNNNNNNSSSSSNNKEGIASSTISSLFPGSSSTAPAAKESNNQSNHSTTTSHLPFHLGRKRAQSNGSNAQELGDMPPAKEAERDENAETVSNADVTEKN